MRRTPSWGRHVVSTVLAAVLAVAGAAGWRTLALDERVAATQDAFVGVVRLVDVEARGDEPWTVVTFAVERWLWRDGRAPGPDAPTEVRVAFLGGRAPGVETRLVAGAPAFATGERLMLWLRAVDDGLALPTVGADQGIWRADDGVWRGDDGHTLGVGAGALPSLDGGSAPDPLLFDALEAAFAATAGGAP